MVNARKKTMGGMVDRLEPGHGPLVATAEEVLCALVMLGALPAASCRAPVPIGGPACE